MNLEKGQKVIVTRTFFTPNSYWDFEDEGTFKGWTPQGWIKVKTGDGTRAYLPQNVKPKKETFMKNLRNDLKNLTEGQKVVVTIIGPGGYWKDYKNGIFLGWTEKGRARIKTIDGKRAYLPDRIAKVL